VLKNTRACGREGQSDSLIRELGIGSSMVFFLQRVPPAQRGRSED
jgi:hypothetical protein